MSEKNLDRNGRWRNITVAFRVSPEENERINAAVRISGLTKQEYITRRLEDMEVVVQGNPKVFWGLREELRAVAEQLRRLESTSDMDPELLAEIKNDLNCDGRNEGGRTMRRKKMTAWYPDVGAFGRQSVNVVQTQLNHIKDRTPVQWISLSVSCPFPAIFTCNTMKRGGNGTCSETNLNST